jgi:hypothetical protein
LRPIVLHIGPHKTGSTSIQRGLDLNPGPLAALGYAVPRLPSAFVSPTESQRVLTTAINRGTTAIDPHWTALLTAAEASEHCFILSFEAVSLHLLNRRKLDKLVATLAGRGFRPCFVYFARDQVSWINSTYVQETKRTYVADGFENYLAKALDAPRFDHDRMTGSFADRDDLDIRVTFFARAARQGLLRSLMGCLGVAERDLEGLIEAPRQNPNAGTRSVHAGRTLARLKAGLGLAPTDRLIADEIKRVSVRQGWDKEPYCGFDDALAERVREAFAASNRRFTDRFGLPPWDGAHPAARWTRAEFDPRKQGLVGRLRMRMTLLRLEAILRLRIASRGR